MWYLFILLFFRILALENIAKILTTGPRLWKKQRIRNNNDGYTYMYHYIVTLFLIFQKKRIQIQCHKFANSSEYLFNLGNNNDHALTINALTLARSLRSGDVENHKFPLRFLTPPEGLANVYARTRIPRIECVAWQNRSQTRQKHQIDIARRRVI